MTNFKYVHIQQLENSSHNRGSNPQTSIGGRRLLEKADVLTMTPGVTGKIGRSLKNKNKQKQTC